jgi:magnesium-transporting ATPase (P-type)
MPADMVLIQSEEIQVDESDMTGESEPIEKALAFSENLTDEHAPNPFLLQNTIAVNGSGLAVVVAVGDNTQAGKGEKKMDFED